MKNRLQRLNLAQRIVVVVALAAMLRVVAGYIVAESIEYPDGGWFAYVPLGSQLAAPGPRPFLAAVVWLACTAVWGVLSVWLLGLEYLRSDP